MSTQQAKQLMPKATKLVRDLMNSSKVVTFYSLPLASSLQPSLPTCSSQKAKMKISELPWHSEEEH